jgi:hypothetical protein
MLITASSRQSDMICLRRGTVCFMVAVLRRCHWGRRVTVVPWLFPAARDPLFGLVGARLAGVGKDPPRRGHVAVRVAPAILDLWRAGVLSAAGFDRHSDSASTDFHTGQRFVTERAIRTPGTDEPRREIPVRIWTFTRLFGWYRRRVS